MCSTFQKCPEAKRAFGIPGGADITPESLRSSPAFKGHAARVIDILDRALYMMEAKELADEMGRLGPKHSKMGITKEMFDALGEGLIHTLSELLPKEDWNEDTKEAWSGHAIIQ